MGLELLELRHDLVVALVRKCSIVRALLEQQIDQRAVLGESFTDDLLELLQPRVLKSVQGLPHDARRKQRLDAGVRVYQ